MLTSLLIAAIGTAQATNVTLPVQMRLVDTLGDAVSGTVTLQVALCPNAVPTGGESCYIESFTNMTPADGFLSLVLGASGGLDHTVFQTDPLYVSYTINSGTEISPRQRVGSMRPRPIGFTGTALVGSTQAEPQAPTTGTVVLSLRFENGFVDESAYAHTVRRFGGAYLTSDAASGDTAVRFGDQGPSYLRIPASTHFAVGGSQDFTIDYWAKYESIDTGGSDQRIFQFGANESNGFRLAHNDAGPDLVNLGSSSSTSIGVDVGALRGDGWHHFAWARQGSTLRVFLDGTLVTSGTYTASNSGSRDMFFATYPGTIGSGTAYWINGSIDDFRFIVGEALYTSNFTAPTSVQQVLTIENGIVTGVQ